MRDLCHLCGGWQEGGFVKCWGKGIATSDYRGDEPGEMGVRTRSRASLLNILQRPPFPHSLRSSRQSLISRRKGFSAEGKLLDRNFHG